MRCDERWEVRISAFLDGELREDEAQATAAHLAECESCRRLRDGLEADRHAFVSLLHRAAGAARVAPIPTAGGPTAERRSVWDLGWWLRRRGSGRARGRREAIYLAAGLTGGAAIGIALALIGGPAGLAYIGTVTEAIGGVEFHSPSGEAIPARAGDRVSAPRRTSTGGPHGLSREPELTTGASSTAEFLTADNCRVVLGPDTRLVLRDRTTLALSSGLVCAALAADKLRGEFAVETSFARFVAKGTRYAVISEPDTPDIHWLVVSAGTVAVRSAQGSGRAPAWAEAKFGPENPGGPSVKPVASVVRVTEWEGPAVVPAGTRVPARVNEARGRLEKLGTPTM